jgi:hypothetical protein
MKIVNRTELPATALAPLIVWVRMHMSEAARQANILIMYKRHNVRVGGIANMVGMGRGRRANGFPPMEPLVTLLIAPNWLSRKYPYTDTYRPKVGPLTYTCWQDHFVALLAHELRHIEQFADLETWPRHLREDDAERCAKRLLAVYQAEGNDRETTEVMEAARQEVRVKTCPRCGFEGPIAEHFGYRTINGGKVIPQSYCHTCRRAHARGRRS